MKNVPITICITQGKISLLFQIDYGNNIFVLFKRMNEKIHQAENKFKYFISTLIKVSDKMLKIHIAEASYILNYLLRILLTT